MAFDQGFALLIGVDIYRHAPERDMPILANDILALKEIVSSPKYCAYPREQVLTLTTSTATRAGILDSLDRLAVSVRREDTGFLFYCGHEDYGKDGSYHLICYDSKIDRNNVVSGAGISQQELLQKIKAIPA